MILEELAYILVAEREKRNLTIDEVCDKTQIRSQYLKAFEQGDISSFSPIYAKSFLKKYCEFLEIPKENYQEVLDKINTLNTKRAFKPISDSHKSVKNSINGSRFSITEWISNLGFRGGIKQETITNFSYGVAAIIVIGLIYFLLFYESGNGPDNYLVSDVADTTEINNSEPESETIALADSVSLEAIAIDTVWVRINIDGNKINEILIKPNEKIIWKAKEYFLFTQGNVGGLELRRDGVLLEPLGKRGTTVKNVKITRDKIRN